MSTFSTKAATALDEATKGGKFVRTDSAYRHIISKDNIQYPIEANRYHLYVSHACPWANRCTAVLNLKSLNDVISTTTVHPTWQKTKPNDPNDVHHGWAFSSTPLVPPSGYGTITTVGDDDKLYNAKFIRDLYELQPIEQQGKYTQ